MYRTSNLIRAVLAIASLAVCLFIVGGDRIAHHLNAEVFKLTYQFLLFVVIGGGLSLLYSRFTAERDLAEERRKLLREMHSELVAAYNTAEAVRRQLRAQVGYDPEVGLPKNATITIEPYIEQMDALMDAQLIFELYARRAKDRKIWFATGDGLAMNLKTVESYLNKIIDEYESQRNAFVRTGLAAKALSELPVLSEFLGSSDSTNFSSQFKKAFSSALTSLESSGLA
ncbi:MAG: hypothetical protein U0930_24365 [Pirellulales bacterium]